MHGEPTDAKERFKLWKPLFSLQLGEKRPDTVPGFCVCMSIDQDSHLTFANKVVQRRAEFEEGRTWSSSDTSFRREIVVDKGSTIRSQISREKTLCKNLAYSNYIKMNSTAGSAPCYFKHRWKEVITIFVELVKFRVKQPPDLSTRLCSLWRSTMPGITRLNLLTVTGSRER